MDKSAVNRFGDTLGSGLNETRNEVQRTRDQIRRAKDRLGSANSDTGNDATSREVANLAVTEGEAGGSDGSANDGAVDVDAAGSASADDKVDA